MTALQTLEAFMAVPVLFVAVWAMTRPVLWRPVGRKSKGLRRD